MILLFEYFPLTMRRCLQRLAILMLISLALCISNFCRQQKHRILCHTNDAAESDPSSKFSFRAPLECNKPLGNHRHQQVNNEPGPENPRENKYRLIKNRKLAMFVSYMAMVAFFFLIFLCRLWDVVEGLVCCLCCCNCPWFWRLVIFLDTGTKDDDIETTSNMPMTATDDHEVSNQGIDQATVEQKNNVRSETESASSSTSMNIDLGEEQKLSKEEMVIETV
jgi:hypothetical protein